MIRVKEASVIVLIARIKTVKLGGEEVEATILITDTNNPGDLARAVKAYLQELSKHQG